MTLNEVYDNTKSQMDNSITYLKNQLSKVRTGRASTSLVDSIRADFYGSMTPLPQMASVSTPDARTIMIQPFDRNTLPMIEKAIRQEDLGFNPQSDGNVIRIPVPPLTEERRKEFVKLSKKYGEETKISIRNTRREQMDVLKEGEKEKEFSEDDRIRGEEKVQEITDEYVKKVDELVEKKEKELLED